MRAAHRGLLWLAATGVAYALCLLLLAAGGDRPGDMAPWLAIPVSSYFWWEAVFIAPVVVAGGLLATSTMYLLGQSISRGRSALSPEGRGASFDDTLAGIGPAVAVCTLFTLIPDLIIGVLLNTGIMSEQAWMDGVTHASVTLALVWTYLSAYILAFLVAFPIVAARTHRLPRLRAIVIGWATFVVYQGFLFVFVR
jgi:hypothetical protein